MKIHTKLTEDNIRHAADVAGVWLAKFETTKSRSHPYRYDMIISGTSGRRSQWRQKEVPAATWDEWGIFLGEIFRLDPNAKTPDYADTDEFHWKTGGRFLTLKPKDQHRQHQWTHDVSIACTGAYFVHQCKCGAITRRMRAVNYGAEGENVFS